MNSKTFTNAYYNISWKDYVPDERIDKFEQELAGEVAKFIARKIRSEFAEEIANNEVSYYVDGGGKFFCESRLTSEIDEL